MITQAARGLKNLVIGPKWRTPCLVARIVLLLGGSNVEDVDLWHGLAARDGRGCRTNIVIRTTHCCFF